MPLELQSAVGIGYDNVAQYFDLPTGDPSNLTPAEGVQFLFGQILPKFQEKMHK